MRRALLLIWAGTAIPFVLTIINGGPDGWLPHLLFHPAYIGFLALALWGVRELRRISGSAVVRGLAAVLGVTAVAAIAGHIGEFVAVLQHGGLHVNETVFATPLHLWSANVTVPAVMLAIVLAAVLSVAAPLTASPTPVGPVVNRWSRSVHRWASIAFVVVLPFALISQQTMTFGVLATAAIAVSVITGLQMNGRHYLTRWRRRSARATRSADSSRVASELEPERIS